MSFKDKLLKLSKAKRILLASLLIIIVCLAIIGGIYVYFFGSDMNIRFKQYVTDINPQDMGVEEFEEDFEYMYNLLEDNFPFFEMNERRMGYNWLDLKEVYLERIRASFLMSLLK